MAKSSSFFGLRTGSTKSLTFQVYRGQQITKDRVFRVSNPRTDAQMDQRAVLPMVAAARSALKGLVDHSFESVPYGEQSLRRFSQLNLRKGALTVDSYAPYGISNPGFSNLIVATGSINVNPIVAWDTNVIGSGSASATFEDPAFPKFKFSALEKDSPGSGVLYFISDYAVANHVELFMPGTQFTFLSCTIGGEVDRKGQSTAPLSKFTINRILMPGDDVPEADNKAVNGDWKVKEAITEGATTAVLYNSVGDTLHIAAVEKGLMFCVVPFDSKGKEAYLASIVSKKVGSVWRRSNARLTLVKDLDNSYTLEEWKANFESSTTSSKYLNNGNEPVGIRS